MRAGVISLLLLGGCWKTDLPSLPQGSVPFTPASGGAPAGWSVQAYDVPMKCPDGFDATFYLVAPDGQTDAMPGAVLLHSGAFDYVIDPATTDKVQGIHYANGESRLTHDWADQRVFVTLGMYDNTDPAEQHQGAIAAALASAGVAMLVPGDCWGDWWHNSIVWSQNDVAADRFDRMGLDASQWAWRLINEPTFGEANRVALPFAFVSGQEYIVGLGEGARGAVNVLTTGARPDAILLDSSTDDLSPYYNPDNATLFKPVLTGLARIFPPSDADPSGVGQTYSGQVQAVATSVFRPGRIGFLYSSQDTVLPAGADATSLAYLNGLPPGEAWVYDAAVPKHVLTGSDLDLATHGVSFLIGNGP